MWGGVYARARVCVCVCAGRVARPWRDTGRAARWSCLRRECWLCCFRAAAELPVSPPPLPGTCPPPRPSLSGHGLARRRGRGSPYRRQGGAAVCGGGRGQRRPHALPQLPPLQARCARRRLLVRPLAGGAGRWLGGTRLRRAPASCQPALCSCMHPPWHTASSHAMPPLNPPSPPPI